jgi:putative peptidoglycan lipid II flippase
MTIARTVLSRGSFIAAGALSSRITGFVRTAAIGAALGAGVVGNSYATSIMLPGVIYEILLGGIAAAVLVPLLNRAKAEHTDEGRAFAQRLLSFAALAFALTAALATAAMPALIPLLGGQVTAGASTNLTVAFAMFTVPAVFFYGVGAVATAILNARGTFALPAWSPACNNLTLITAAIVLIAFPADEFGALRVGFLGGATLLGAALQAALLFPAMRRAGIRWRWQPSLRGFGLRRLARTLAWVACYVTVGQIAVVVIIGLTRAAGEHGGPGPLIYNNAWIVLMMAYGVLSLPIITALTPDLSERRNLASAATANTYATGFRLIILTAAPATAAMIALAQPVAIAVFQWGNYTRADALDTAAVIAAAGFALIPYGLTQLQFFTFLALGDARTPAVVMLAATVVRIGLCVAAYAIVPAERVAAAMMAANAASYAVAAAIAMPLLHRRLGVHRLVSVRLVVRAAVTIVLLVALSAALWGLLEHFVPEAKTASLLVLGAAAPLFAIAYVPLLHNMRAAST